MSSLIQASQSNLVHSTLKFTPAFANGEPDTPFKLTKLALERLRSVDPWNCQEEEEEKGTKADPFQPFSEQSEVVQKMKKKNFIHQAMCYKGTERKAGSKETPNVYRLSGVYPASLADCVKFYDSISTQKKSEVNPNILMYDLTEDLKNEKLDEIQAQLQSSGEKTFSSVRRACYIHWASKRPSDKHSDLDFMDFSVHFKTKNSNRLLVAIASAHNKHAPTTRYRRAENELRCVYLRPDPANPNQTLFTWSVSVHFQNMSHELFQDIACAFIDTLHTHCEYLASQVSK